MAVRSAPNDVNLKETPTCPKCGQLAWETGTKYGIRAECCGLWSWNRAPLADAATHKLRQQVNAMIGDLGVSNNTFTVLGEMTKRAGWSRPIRIGEMNEVTARKALTALEDIVMDIMAGNDPLKGKR